MLQLVPNLLPSQSFSDKLQPLLAWQSNRGYVFGNTIIYTGTLSYFMRPTPTSLVDAFTTILLFKLMSVMSSWVIYGNKFQDIVVLFEAVYRKKSARLDNQSGLCLLIARNHQVLGHLQRRWWRNSGFRVYKCRTKFWNVNMMSVISPGKSVIWNIML